MSEIVTINKSDGENNKTEELFEAAEHNDLETVKKFVGNEGTQASIRNSWGQTIAHIAAKNGNLDMVKYIADKEPAVLGLKDRNGLYVLEYAVQSGHMDTIKYLEEKYLPSVSNLTRHDYESVAIHAAIRFDHLDIVKYFIEERKSDVNIKDEFEESPVFTAIGYKRPDVFKYLVEEKKVNLTLLDRYNANILFEFLRNDDVQTMTYLLDEKKVPLDVNWQNSFNDTLLHKATHLNRINMIKYLVGEKHADVNVVGSYEMTPLHCAACRNNYEICKYFIEHGANLQAVDEKGETPLQKATNEQLIELMKNATTVRSRRSLDLYNGSPSSLISTPYESWPQHEIISTPRLRVGVVERSIDASYPAHFRSLLVMADSMIRRTKFRGGNHSDLRSPSATLRNRFDPIAEEAANIVQNFE